MRSRTIITALTTAATLGLAGPAAAQTVLSEQSRPFSVDATPGVIVFSQYQADIDAYRLVAREDGEERTLNVEPSPEPFDVDVGTSSTGRLVAVYSRSVSDEEVDLFRYSFASDSETHLTSLSIEDAVERDPSVHRGQIAFVRATREGSRLMIANTGANGAPRTLVTRRGSVGPIRDPDLSSLRVAYTTVGQDGDRRFQAMHVRNLRDGKDRTVKVVANGQLSFAALTGASFSHTGRALYFASTAVGSGTGNRYLRWSATQGLSETRGTSQAIDTAWSGGSLGLLVVRNPGPDGTCSRDSTKGTCDLIATGPLRFTRR
ncbi:MAG: hypothetical protein MSC31_15410 [Solirubrobacteraceae bacterium MAG38_C4-C5]|nr:hypothetical protein [Candidatus Siliceabacter maunaloa]